MRIPSDFYCKDCERDFSAEGEKVFMNRVFTQALVTNCEMCGEMCYRGLVNRQRDPYYLRSRKLRKARRKYAKDIMQRDDPMFNFYHPEQRREEIEKENQKEYELWKRKQ